MSAWLISKRGNKKRVRSGALNSLTERYYVWNDEKEAKGKLDIETVVYKKECVMAIRKQWTGFSKLSVDKLTKSILEAWTGSYAKQYRASRANGAITVIREMLELAQEDDLLTEVELVRLRKGLTYATVDYDYKRMNGNYFIPLFPELEAVLLKLRTWSNKTSPTNHVFPTRSLQTVLTSACKALQARGLKRPHLSAHDLRHIFATRCIEWGADWVTLASWLGQGDNGRTAMLVYAHIRKRHSHELAGGRSLLPGSTVHKQPTQTSSTPPSPLVPPLGTQAPEPTFDIGADWGQNDWGKPPGN